MVSCRRSLSFLLLLGLVLGGLFLPEVCNSREALQKPEFRLGFSLEYADSRGAFPVISVLYGSPADRSGLRVGDYVFPPAEADPSPEGVLAFLSRQMQQGFSVLLRGEREGLPQTYWLRPYRFSSSQEKLVTLSLAMEQRILRGKTLWEDALQAFDSYLYREYGSEKLGSRLSELREELLEASWKLRNESIPSELSPEIRGNFIAARELYARAMDLRREAMLNLMDVVAHREESLSLQQGRRREAEQRARTAQRLESRGAGELLQALRRGALSEQEIELLFHWERGFAQGESRHPKAFEEAPPLQKKIESSSALEGSSEKYAFFGNIPWNSDRMAYWAGEKLLVFWKGDAPKYLFLWTGLMWYQVALGDAETMGEALQRSRHTLRQQRQQNRFEVPQQDLAYVTSLGERENLHWMGMLGW
ncbi:MAG TPA: PDZ domain-containing protein [Synergistaceae bacterium]|nr:PDZ domain-containing protein [Synergistaceae bacterium]